LRNQKVKILYIVSTLKQSGPTNQLLGLVENINKAKFDISVLTLSPEPFNSKKNEFLSEGIKVDSLELTRVEFIIKGKRRLKNYIKKYNPDIIHSSGIRADIAITKIKSNIQHCMTVHNYAFDDFISKYGYIIGKLAAESYIKAMQNCNYVICCSKTLKQMYQKKLNQKLYYVQNGINTEKFKFPKNIDTKLSLRSKLNLPYSKKVILVVGSLIKRKDPLTIIRAFKQSNVGGRALLVLIGDGNLLEQCTKEADEHILVKGNVNNVRDYLHASDIYISASKSEGLPNSVLEAGSSGLNVILSNIPQHREIFEAEGRELFFYKFEVGNVEALSSIIKEKVEERSVNINYKLANYIYKNFSNKNMSKKYEKLYLNMIK